jgi:hypothetical protein
MCVYVIEMRERRDEKMREGFGFFFSFFFFEVGEGWSWSRIKFYPHTKYCKKKNRKGERNPKSKSALYDITIVL